MHLMCNFVLILLLLRQGTPTRASGDATAALSSESVQETSADLGAPVVLRWYTRPLIQFNSVSIQFCLKLNCSYGRLWDIHLLMLPYWYRTHPLILPYCCHTHLLILPYSYDAHLLKGFSVMRSWRALVSRVATWERVLLRWVWCCSAAWPTRPPFPSDSLRNSASQTYRQKSFFVLHMCLCPSWINFRYFDCSCEIKLITYTVFIPPLYYLYTIFSVSELFIL